MFDRGLGDYFLEMTPKAQAIKVKINTWGYIKTKSFSTATETINKVKGEPMDWEEIFTNHVFNKGLIFKIYKILIQLDSITINNPI